MLATRIVTLLFALLLYKCSRERPAGTQRRRRSGADRLEPHQSRPSRRRILPFKIPTAKPITLSDFRDKKSVVLVFYRGYW